MNKPVSFRINPWLAAALIVAGFFIVLFTAYGLTLNVSDEEVMGRVYVAGTNIGGLKKGEATAAVLEVEDEFLARPAYFNIDGRAVVLDPNEAGFDVDEDAIIDEAMKIGRGGNGAYRFLWWVRHIFSSVDIAPVGDADPELLSQIFDFWDAEVIGMPANLGGITNEDGVLTPQYPHTGIGLDRAIGTKIVTETLLAIEPAHPDLPTVTIVARLTDQDVDDALAVALDLISEPIRMVYDGDELVFTPQQLASAYRSETVSEGAPRIVHSFDPEVIDSYLDTARSKYEAEPVDAEFVISGDTISIAPGKRGTRISEEETAQKLLQAGLTGSRLGQLPLVEDAEPDVTAASLEALGIKHLVSSFTTYHACCEDRVINIQKMADTIDGAIVPSGQEFSINRFVGERTEEKGYVPAGTIIAGEFEDTFGGGVSQFATTMYAAMFWGGYEDVEHKVHSYYFSRYPEGIEATVSWQTPNLTWANNSRNAVLIDTRHTDDSITVRIFGDNDGRTVIGEHKGGVTTINVTSRGGENALHVEAEVSERFAITEPGSPEFRPNPAFEVDESEEIQTESEGWSVTIVRRILRNGTDVIATREWVARYLPRHSIVEVHPCKMPGKEATCPTTTTVAPPTTTTVPPDPTTTITG